MIGARAAISSQFANGASLDVFEPALSPPGDQRHVGYLARLLFVRRTFQQPNVLASTAFLARVALDVLASEIRERLRAPFLDLPPAGILALGGIAERVRRLLTSRRQAQRGKPAERQASERLAHPVHQDPRSPTFG